MSHILANTEPLDVWNHFYALTQIPRPSKGERTVCRYIYNMAKDLGLEVSMDTTGGNDFGNIIVKCPATPSLEETPIIVLQSHVDIVALPDERKDLPLELILDGTILRARGTTLGADNGIAVAIALCMMTGSAIEHGPLELLFTVNEEAGMTGARMLSENALKGHFLINIDSQQEGALVISSAGGGRSVFQLPVIMEQVIGDVMPVLVSVTGGKGGHSGFEINSGRANVGQLLARILYEALKMTHLRLNDITWGTVDNAIPSEARATILVKPEHLTGMRDRMRTWEKTFMEEYGKHEGPLQVRLGENAELPEFAMSTATTKNVLSFLLALPHGVRKMSSDIGGLVETSSNVASVQTSQAGITVTVSQRSSIGPSLDAVINQCEAVADLAGAGFIHAGRHYGWKPDIESKLLAICRNAHKQIYGTEPEIQALHAMLECGLIKEKYPHMDMISIGPTILDAHAPTKPDYVSGRDSDSTGERIDTAQMPRFWEFVKAILKKSARAES